MQFITFLSLKSVIARVDMEVYSPKQINYHTNAINLDCVLCNVHLIIQITIIIGTAAGAWLYDLRSL